MAYFLILFGVLMRLATHFQDYAPLAPILKYLPHIPNFAPIAAMALFGGVYLSRKHALIIPVIAMLIADYFIGFYNPWIMASVYGSFILIGLLGLWLRSHKTLPNIIGGSLTGSIVFFLVTNFSMWIIPHSLYPHTWQGLVSCYIMGLPFFRGTITGDLFYVGALFGLMEAMVYVYNKFLSKKESHVTTRMARERIR